MNPELQAAIEYLESQPPHDANVMLRSAKAVLHELKSLRVAVRMHHGQKADDRCIEDDDRLYAAFGLSPCDRRVGSKDEMLKNCARFIDRRCQGGHWPSYADLEARVVQLEEQLKAAQLRFPD